MTDETPYSGEQRSTNSRRSVLRLGGLAAASLVGASTAGAVSARDDDGPNTDFDPDNDEAALEFLLEMFEKSENQTCSCNDEVWHDLTNEQIDAVGDTFEENLNWTVSREPNTMQQTSSDTWLPGDETVEAEADVMGYDVYTHIQEVEWDYNGDDYRAASQEHDYECHGLACSFNGLTTDELNRRTTYFDATLAGEYAFEPAGIGVVEVESVIESRARRDGDFQVLEKEAPGT
ncbi:hypothetical protein C482_06067 [Natrialba chahannaoensis JCM 10990]|uniref:Uncharacterized protein n=1 Tax=Natrialba chahannaoensis JCM 10990 TaxID=1227492 RepID=M0AW28_9EURY|nr:hypothetical protein [Natrialba chahannaoensis]ELZ01594.1 hypothetical protein C482_06067 [Natrialba chahannaoensis JCM 10990]